MKFMEDVAGFSFLELLCCLSLLSLLLISSVPFTASFFQQNQLQVLQGDISNILRYARNKALCSKETLILTPLPHAEDWSKGMVLFVDNPMHRSQYSDSIIQRWDWNYPGTSVIWHGFQSKHYILLPKDLRQAAMNGRFILSNKTKRKELIINRLGRITAVKD